MQTLQESSDIPHRAFRESLQSLHTSLTGSSQNLQRVLAGPPRIFTESSQKLKRMLTEASKMPRSSQSPPRIFTVPSQCLHRAFQESSQCLHNAFTEASKNPTRQSSRTFAEPSHNDHTALIKKLFRTSTSPHRGSPQT